MEEETRPSSLSKRKDFFRKRGKGSPSLSFSNREGGLLSSLFRVKSNSPRSPPRKEKRRRDSPLSSRRSSPPFSFLSEGREEKGSPPLPSQRKKKPFHLSQRRKTSPFSRRRDLSFFSLGKKRIAPPSSKEGEPCPSLPFPQWKKEEVPPYEGGGLFPFPLRKG